MNVGTKARYNFLKGTSVMRQEFAKTVRRRNGRAWPVHAPHPNLSALKDGRVVYMEEQELKDVLGKNIKVFRSLRQLSQTALAEKAGISITFLSNIERGNNFPLAGTFCSLAKVLGVEVFELFKGELVPSDSKAVICKPSKDITEKMNLAVADIFKQYLG
jgi:transcriptional regulator with XRE-family HTH domain